jgi:hypothetical protein
MHWALEDGAYRAFGYICMGSISYDPIPNSGEGALGQGNCGLAILDVIDTVRLATCLDINAAMCVLAYIVFCIYSTAPA